MFRRKKTRVDVLPGSPKHFRVEFEHDVIKTLDEARQVLDAYVVLEGDYGGQTYLTAPVKLVQCDEETIRRLLEDIDQLARDDPDGQLLSYQKHRVGDHFGGGMGGAEATGDLWVHKRLSEMGITDHVRKVILGETPRLGLPAQMIDQIRRDRRSRIEAILRREEKPN